MDLLAVLSHLLNSLQMTHVSKPGHADLETSKGHMFNQHYLDPMFPLPNGQSQAMKGEKTIRWKPRREVAGHNNDHARQNYEETFLDRTVTPDEKLGVRRECTVLAEMGIMRRESGLEFGDGQLVKDSCGLAKRKDSIGDEFLTFVRTGSDRVVAEEARGKTVKELSRLWKYLGGKSPKDHDQIRDGYHDGPPNEDRKNRHDSDDQRKVSQQADKGSGQEQQKSPITSVLDRSNPSFHHASPSDDEQSLHVSYFSNLVFCHSHSC